MKIDKFHQIQMGSVYRGLTPVPDEEIQRVYKGSYVPRHYIRSRDEVNILFKCSLLIHIQNILVISYNIVFVG